MLKKTFFTLLAILAISIPAHSIELPSGATPNFGKSSTAYSSSYEFNNIMEAYGLSIDPEAVSDVPPTFAKVSDGNVSFNNDSIAYTPVQYHSILTAYGLELSPDAVTEKLGPVSSYAKVSNDTVVFGDDSVAYGGSEWETIMSAYSLPVVAAPVPVAAAPPAPADSDGDGVIDDKDACPGTPLGIAVDSRGCWAISHSVLFDLNKAIVKPEAYPFLNDSKIIFDKYPTMKVRIEGHTDSTGTEAYNQSLSEKRANAVMDYLVNKVGIDQSRLSAAGYGESRPAASNKTKEGRAQNRRVEFTPLT